MSSSCEIIKESNRLLKKNIGFNEGNCVSSTEWCLFSQYCIWCARVWDGEKGPLAPLLFFACLYCFSCCLLMPPSPHFLQQIKTQFNILQFRTQFSSFVFFLLCPVMLLNWCHLPLCQIGLEKKWHKWLISKKGKLFYSKVNGQWHLTWITTKQSWRCTTFMVEHINMSISGL